MERRDGMEIKVSDASKSVDVWLTRAEQGDPTVQEQLKGLYAEYAAKKYMVVVYHSGDRDLYQSTLDLLRYNRRRSAEREVQQEKRQRTAGMER